MKNENISSLSRFEISVFSENMAILLKAGIQTNEAVTILCEDLGSGRLKTVLQKLSSDIMEMYSVHNAVVAAGCFPKYFVDMVEVGETTGKLEQMFFALSAYYKRESELEQRTKSAVVYPVVMISLMAAVVFFLIYSVMPIFKTVFEQMGSGLTASSTASMNLGFMLGNVAFFGIIILLALIVVIALLTRTYEGGAVISQMLEKLWFTRKMMYQIAASKLSYALATFISSGINTDKAMEMAANMITHKELHKKLLSCIAHMKDGDSLAGAMSKEGVFGSMFGKMFVSSMKSGAQDVAMSRLADLYETETGETIDGFISSIVPILTACMTVIVGVVLASVMMPLVGIMSSMG